MQDARLQYAAKVMASLKVHLVLLKKGYANNYKNPALRYMCKNYYRKFCGTLHYIYAQYVPAQSIMYPASRILNPASHLSFDTAEPVSRG